MSSNFEIKNRMWNFISVVIALKIIIVFANEESYIQEKGENRLYTQHEQNHFHISKRMRRDVEKQEGGTIYVLNKSGTEVDVFHVGYGGYRHFYMRLRRNEARTIRSRYGTTWVAYDANTDRPFLLNGKYNYLNLVRDLEKKTKISITRRDSNYKKTIPKQLRKKYLEVLVITDASVTRHHGKNTERYVRILINVVNRIMKDKTLDIDIEVVVSKVLTYTRDPPGLNISKDSKNSIRTACQIAANVRQRGVKYDFAIFMTRKYFKFSGFTPLFKMCSAEHSCALIKDQGWHISFVIAHEIGHALGLHHDGEDNDCGGAGKKWNIMNPTVYSKHDRYFWSECSKNEIKETINYFRCLDNIPSTNNTEYSVNLAGTYATIDEQCKYYLGNAYVGCTYEWLPYKCNRLWCRVQTNPGRRRRNCVSLVAPPLDGTACGNNKWCFRGKCFQHGRYSEPPVHGNWGTWSRWSQCSRQCGTGIKRKQRHCDNPRPRFDGKECEGPKEAVASCNLKDCRLQKSISSLREDSCTRQHGEDWHYYSIEDMKKSLSDPNLDCDFETNSCSWHQNSSDDKFDWVRHSGHTGSTGTGPSVDHTKGDKKGVYMYIEASDYPEARREKGYNAILTSPRIKVPTVCLQFYYHMYGDHTGSVNVYQKGVNDTSIRRVWSANGNQGNQWLKANISISSKTDFEILIEAVRGTHYRSDSAIDDISVGLGDCAKPVEPCQISCHELTGHSLSNNLIATDGDKCYNNNREDICIAGSCHVHGCDGILGSNSQLDQCGVCDGNGATCIVYEGKINVRTQNSKRHTLGFIIPKGAYNISVKMETNTSTVIGLRGDRFFYYKDNTIKSRYVVLHKTTFRFTRIRNTSLFESSNRIVKPLKVMVVTDEPKSETIKLEFRFSAAPTSFVAENNWTECSSTCGYGFQRFQTRCFVNSNTDRVEVDKLFCRHFQIQQSEQRTCQNINCNRYEWQATSFTSCSVTCGQGVQSREVKCIDRLKSNSVVDGKNCNGDEPFVTAKCSQKKCIVSCKEPRSRCAYYKRKGYCTFKVMQRLCCDSCLHI